MNTRTSYDAVAAEYAKRFVDELQHKPFDREQLEAFAARLKNQGWICDVGCGSGQIGRYIAECGAKVLGLDLSHGLLTQARSLHPMLAFQQGDMGCLPFKRKSLAGITAFYSIIHIPREKVTSILREWRRVLQPEGQVLLSFHVGDEVVHLEEWWGQRVSLDFTFFQPDEMRGYLESSGFGVENVQVRLPYEGVEHPSQRCYMVARGTHGEK